MPFSHCACLGHTRSLSGCGLLPVPIPKGSHRLVFFPFHLVLGFVFISSRRRPYMSLQCSSTSPTATTYSCWRLSTPPAHSHPSITTWCGFAPRHPACLVLPCSLGPCHQHPEPGQAQGRPTSPRLTLPTFTTRPLSSLAWPGLPELTNERTV